MQSPVDLFIGLMSGTSIDAVDGVLVRCTPRFETLALATLPFPDALRAEFQSLQQPGPNELERAALAANSLAELYAQVAHLLIAESQTSASAIQAIGAHGQTVRHQPGRGFTLQLLNGALLAELTGLPVVSDLRSADVAAGGQGAPLVPAFHASVFAHPLGRRAIVNLGGLANISLLPALMDPASGEVLGHDTGPGNTLLDQWCERHLGKAFDQHGAWAASGRVDAPLLDLMLSDPYFAALPPKSTGRDHFNLGWLEIAIATRGKTLAAEDVQASLAELTARSISQDCLRWRADEVFLCGGGAFNSDLVSRLRRLMPACPVATTQALDIHPMAVEAAAFAWLAARRVALQAGNLPRVTGARGPRVLGALHHPRMQTD